MHTHKGNLLLFIYDLPHPYKKKQKNLNSKDFICTKIDIKGQVAS